MEREYGIEEHNLFRRQEAKEDILTLFEGECKTEYQFTDFSWSILPEKRADAPPYDLNMAEVFPGSNQYLVWNGAAVVLIPSRRHMKIAHEDIN